MSEQSIKAAKIAIAVHTITLDIEDNNDPEIGIWHLVASMMDYADQNGFVFENIASKNATTRTQIEAIEKPKQPSDSMVMAATAALAVHNVIMPISDEQNTVLSGPRNLLASLRDYAKEKDLDLDLLIDEVRNLRPEWK